MNKQRLEKDFEALIDFVLTAFNDVTTTRIYNDLTHIVVASLLILDNDLVLAGLDEPCKDENIVLTLLFSVPDLHATERLTALQLATYVRLGQVADQDVFLGVWQVLFQTSMPVLFRDNSQILAERVLHALADGENSLHGARTLVSQLSFDVVLVQEEIEPGDVCQAHHCVSRDAAKKEWITFVLHHD